MIEPLDDGSSCPPLRRCSPTTCRTATASSRTASSASSGPAGTTCTWPSGGRPARPAALRVHLHRLGRPGRAARRAWVHVADAAALARLGAVGGFDLVHQLNPVDVGREPRAGGRRSPLVLGPYMPDWAPSGPGADAPVGRPRRCASSACCARPSSAGRRTVLLSTPAAVAKLEPRRGGTARVHERRPASTTGPGARPRPGPAARTSCSWPTSRCARASTWLLDAFEPLAPRLPGARLLIAGAGPRRPRCGAACASTPALARVELLGRVDRDASWRHAGMRRLLPALLSGSRSG